MQLNRPLLAWALYDWANSVFAVVVLTTFFPLFFRDHWAEGLGSTETTFQLGLANASASLLIVIAAPLLGAIADQGGLRKRMLLLAAAIGITATAGFFWIPQGAWLPAVALFLLATVAWMAANVFYDALLLEVAPKGRFDQVSALGFALGYLGSGLMFAGCIWMTLDPALFGLADPVAAVRLTFLLTALWWALFTLPLLLWVTERKRHHGATPAGAARRGYRQLLDTFRQIRRLRPVLLFLAAYWLYIDGVDTVIRMAVDYGKAIGFDTAGLIKAVLVTQFVAFPAALFFGWLGGRIGARNAILIGIGAYVAMTIWASQITQSWEFYGLAVGIGLFQGGIQSLSRSYYACLIPADQAAEFFGFYNMLGKFAAIVGPMMVGTVGMLTGDARTGLLSLLVLFGAGGALLLLQPAQCDAGTDLR